MPASLRAWWACRLHALDKGVYFVNFLSLKNGLAQPCKQLLKRSFHPLFCFVSSPLGLPQRPFQSSKHGFWPSTTPLFSPQSMAFGLPQRSFSVLKAWLSVFHNALFSPRSMALGLQVHMDWTVKAGGLRCKRPALVSQKYGGWRPQEADCSVCLCNLLDISAL